MGVLLVGIFLPTHFSVAQNYHDLTENSFLNRLLNFIMPNYEIYLHATTEPNRYTIYFDGNWGVWTMSTMSMIYDKEKNLIPNNFTRDWYSFQWRSSDRAWTVEYLDQAEVKNLTTEYSGKVTLYAQRIQSEAHYIIEYRQENVAWTWYELVETGSMYGSVGTGIVLTWRIYPWFTLQTGAEVIIVPGGYVSYFYTRNSYNLTIKYRDNTLISTWIRYWADIPLPSDPEWTWNTFEWWNNLPSDGKMPANNLEITSTRTYWTHTITFDTDGWTEIAPISKNYWEPIEIPQNPTREWYEFVWWSPQLPNTMPYDDITLKAIWKEIDENKWTWWSGRWRNWDSSDDSTWESEHGSADEINFERSELEILAAYMWAYRKWIIWTGRKDSDPDGYIPRWDMAEMVVKFTENVLWKKVPSIPAYCKWWDVEHDWKSSETKVYAQKACALWVMWIRMENFMPNKLIDRAEFWTILSRLLWWDKYDVVNATRRNPYYTRHLDALNKAGVMKQIDNPESRNELRKWAWIMLMRVKYIK